MVPHQVKCQNGVENKMKLEMKQAQEHPHPHLLFKVSRNSDAKLGRSLLEVAGAVHIICVQDFSLFYPTPMSA